MIGEEIIHLVCPVCGGGAVIPATTTFLNPWPCSLDSDCEGYMTLDTFRPGTPKRPVTLTVLLPEPEAELIEEIHRDDPLFIPKVLLYGLCRRSIYQFLRNDDPAVAYAGVDLAEPGGDRTAVTVVDCVEGRITLTEEEEPDDGHE